MDEVDLFEVMCRGSAKCGTFVAARKVEACPKCGDAKVAVRSIPRSG